MKSKLKIIRLESLKTQTESKDAKERIKEKYAEKYQRREPNQDTAGKN